MKIFHMSDTHGSGFWDKPLCNDVDVVAHSGDAFPNQTRGIVDKEVAYQTAWLGKFVEPIKKWLDGRPFVYVPGNHDYIEFADFFPSHRVTPEPTKVCDKLWRGFREIPWIRGEWRGEVREPEMSELIEDIFGTSNSLSFTDGDILLCHAPPAGIFDLDPSGIHRYGIGALSNALQYRNHSFKAVLFGHVHQKKYMQENRMGIVFSNAADTEGGIVELP